MTASMNLAAIIAFEPGDASSGSGTIFCRSWFISQRCASSRLNICSRGGGSVMPRPVMRRRKANEFVDFSLFGRSEVAAARRARRAPAGCRCRSPNFSLPAPTSNRALAHGLDAPPVARQHVLVLLEPERGGGGDLRRRGRRALAVQADDVRRSRTAPTGCSACRRRAPSPSTSSGPKLPSSARS